MIALKKSVALAIIFLGISGQFLLAQSPYKLDWKKEAVTIGLGLSSYTFGQFTEKNIKPLTPFEIENLNRNNIHPFDRATVNNYDMWAADISNVGVYSLITSPVLLAFAPKIRKDWQTIGLLYVETLGLSATLPNWTKNTVQRVRPFVYNPDVPIDKKMELDAQKSFFSSHTCIAFSSAVFLSTVYSTYYPTSKWRPWIWTGSLLAASTVGYMRYQSGNHFPSDIIVGAAVGSVVGYLIPRIHRNKLHSNLSILPNINSQNIGVHISYTFDNNHFRQIADSNLMY